VLRLAQRHERQSLVDELDAPPWRQDLQGSVDVPLGEDDVAPVEDPGVGVGLARQSLEGVPLGLDLEAIHGRAYEGDIRTLIRRRHPELEDSLSRGRSAG
jgi:hypothetical protein